MKWNEDNFLSYIYSLRDEKYREFTKKLVTSKYEIIGIRIPVLKKLAKDLAKNNIDEILNISSHDIFEIYMLKGLVISNIKDKSEARKQFLKYIEFIDNWSLCDTFISSFKIIKNDKEFYFKKATELINSSDEFKERVGLVIMLDYFLDDESIDEIFKLIGKYHTEKYYSKMALAWLLSVAYVKYLDKTKKFIENSVLDRDILKMTERKIKDSFRVSSADKEWIIKKVNFELNPKSWTVYK